MTYGWYDPEDICQDDHPDIECEWEWDEENSEYTCTVCGTKQ